MTDGRSDEPHLQEIVIIDGDEYNILMMDPVKAFKTGVRLMKIIGSPMGTMTQGAGDAKKAIEAVPAAIEALMRNIEPEFMQELALELFRHVRFDNQELTKDKIQLHFRGRPGLFVKVFMKCVEVQFQDFFDAVIESVRALTAKKKDPQSESQSTSVGQSVDLAS